MEARNGGSDRAFWLEAFGGRAFTVERMSREPLTVERLAVGVLGGIQPDRLAELLLRSRDDGLLARFLPVWPHPAPVTRPRVAADDALADAAFARLLAFEVPTDGGGEPRPWFVPFEPGAQDAMLRFRERARIWEASAGGLLLSHVGKLPGIAARLALVLACLDHAFEGGPTPQRIMAETFDRACRHLEHYALPMARRCYAAAAAPEVERKARRLLAALRERELETFTAREAQRWNLPALGDAASLRPVLIALVEGDALCPLPSAPGAKGGRPVQRYALNPALSVARRDRWAA